MARLGEVELEVARARAALEAMLTRAGITADWSGGSEQGAALITSSPRCRGSNATSVGHSPNEGARYGISEYTRFARNNLSMITCN